MTRYVNPTPQYLDGAGNPVVYGKLWYFKSGQSGASGLLTTYADELQTVENTNPVILDEAGRTPNVFYEGSARVVLQDACGIQIWERDPVGGEQELSNFELWDSVVIYDVNDIVEGSNGAFYISLTNGNQGNDPTLSAGDNSNWSEIRYLGVWNEKETYLIGEVVQTSGGYLWRSAISGNLGNNPTSDNGTNWTPPIDPLKLPSLTEVVPQTGGGELTALRTNEIRDSSAYTFPLASSVKVNETITFDLPERYKVQTPSIAVSGADTITVSTGTDTSFVYGGLSYGTFTMTSDGVSNWSI